MTTFPIETFDTQRVMIEQLIMNNQVVNCLSASFQMRKKLQSHHNYYLINCISLIRSHLHINSFHT